MEQIYQLLGTFSMEESMKRIQDLQEQEGVRTKYVLQFFEYLLLLSRLEHVLNKLCTQLGITNSNDLETVITNMQTYIQRISTVAQELIM